jgi:dTDP-4-dehydrorhamnose reductase
VRIFVTGGAGLVGRELRAALAARGRVAVAWGDLPAFDARLPGVVAAAFRRHRPDLVVHLAAWTEVDRCEEDPSRARRDNGVAAGVVARAAAAAGARVLLVSTDYVFDGASDRPWREDDRPRPLSAYGRSKLLGEHEVRAALRPGRWTIVRGQSLYGAGRKSFPDAVLGAAAKLARVPVVTDQVVAPTWARDFARGLVDLVAVGASGVFHLSASGRCSWNECARAAFEEAGLAPERVVAQTTEERLAAAPPGAVAPRPAWSVFDLGRFERATGRRPRPWREQLRDYLASTGRAAASGGRAA